MSPHGKDGARQRTIGGPAVLEGTGLHTGRTVRARLLPAAPGTGLVFRRVDLPGQPIIRAAPENVSGVEWETVIGSGEAVVRTIEHLLAALAAAGVDNVEIELEGEEPPALDGSSARWCRVLDEVGVVEQEGSPHTVTVDRTLSVAEGDSRYTIAPYPGYRVSAHIDFDHPVIGRQFASVEVERDAFWEEVAPARTFGLERWREPLVARGLARGASHDNTIVLTDDGLAPGVELRFPDEFVRHKLIDLIGDLALIGARIRGHVVAERPSHRGNVAVARALRGLLDGREEGPVLDIQAILRYIPHRFPFLLVDRVIEFEPGKRIVGLKNVTMNEPFFTGHFPDHPIMPGVLIIEAMAQVGGLLLMNEFERPEEKLVYFMALDDVKFRRPVTPGDQLIFELELVQLRGRTCRMRGKGRVDGRVVAEATMLARVVDR